MIAAATGNPAKIYRLNSGFLHPGRDADVLLIDAPLGGSKRTALDALENGDVTGALACFTAGVPRYIGRSRCTPPPMRYATVVKNTVINDFPAPPLV
jgi:enamidase